MANNQEQKKAIPSVPGVVSVCKITAGIPTSMRRSTAEKMCKANQAAMIPGASDKPLNQFCQACAGTFPPELTFIDEDTIIKQMPSNNYKKDGACECCGKSATLQSNNKKMVCSTCTVIRSTVKKHGAIVCDVLREFHGSIVPMLTDEETQSVIKEYCGDQELLESDNARYEELRGKYEDVSLDNKRLEKEIEELRLLSVENQEHISQALELQEALDKMTTRYERSIVERTHLQAKLESGNGIDKAKLLTIALDLAQYHLDGSIKVNAECFKELRRVASA